MLQCEILVTMIEPPRRVPVIILGDGDHIYYGGAVGQYRFPRNRAGSTYSDPPSGKLGTDARIPVHCASAFLYNRREGQLIFSECQPMRGQRE